MAYIPTEGQAVVQMGKAAKVESAGFIVSNIGQAVSGIWGDILLALAGSTLDSLRPQIKGYVGRHMILAQSIKDVSPDNAVSQIETILHNEYQDLITLTKAGMGQKVGGLHASLYETLSGTSALLAGYNGIIQRVGIDPYITRLVNSTVMPNIPDTSTAWMLRKLGVITDAMYKEYAKKDGWDATTLAKMESIYETAVPMNMLFDMLRRNYISSETGKVQMRRLGWREDIIDKAIFLVEQVPEPYRLADFASKDVITDVQSRAAFKWFGLSSGWADFWKESQYRIPDIGVLFELLWRGVLDDSQLTTMLSRSGLHPLLRGRIKNLTQLIPPSADLITMVVREAFEAENVVQAPEVFAEYMAKKGYSRAWADRYWTAHFLPMAVNLAYRNLHRGLWTKEEFLELLRIADIHPRWREDIYNVAFEPPSIREMGYGYDVNAYTRADIIRYRRWGGLSEEDATKAADSLVAYRTEAEREAIRRNYMYLYTLGHMTNEEFGDALDSVGTNPEARLLWLERGELEKLRKELETPPEEPRTITRGTAQWLFERELRTEEWFKTVLEFLGYSEDAIDAYTDQSLERIRLEKVERETFVPRKLTLAQLKSLYQHEYIDEDALITGLMDLNYDFEVAFVLSQQIIDEIYAPLGQRVFTLSQMVNFYELNLVDEKQIHEFLERQGYTYPDATLLTQYIMITSALPDLKAQYSKGWISATSMYQSLLDLDVPEERAKMIMKTIVKNTQGERLEDERELTKAEIIKGAKSGVLNVNEAVALLQNIGYEEWEGWYLLAINSVVAAGDPQGYWEMRRVTEMYKRARGEPFIDIPKEVIIFEQKVQTARKMLLDAKAAKKSDEEIGDLAVKLNDLEINMKKVVAKLGLK